MSWDTRECVSKVKKSKKIKSEGGIMKEFTKGLKGYFEDNQETIITIGIAILLDHYLFGGTLREKLKSLIEGLFTSAEAKLLSVKSEEQKSE